jgi:hypothetical protein
MANTNPGGLDLNTSPYFDDYNEDKKFVRVLYRPGRAVQARELTQAQTLQQVQTRRFAEYFFKQGALVDGCEQNLDLNLSFVKLQPTYNSNTVAVANFVGSIIYGANSGIKAYCGLVEDIDGTDPKTLFINYATNGTQVLTVNVAPTTLTSGNTITFSTGNTATIEAFYTDPISGAIKIFVSNTSGTLTATTANTVLSTGVTQVINVTSISNQSANTKFANSETIFTANTTGRAYALAAATNAVRNVVNEGLATEQVYDYGSKITVSEGVVYVADHFVKHSTQTIILDKYTNEPSYRVGLVPTKTFIDYIEDQSLVDNAQGTPNFQAPGADRLKIDTTLTKIALGATTDENEFITITEIEDGIARKRKSITVDNKLEDVLAKRTNEESGNYTLSDPVVYVREHLTTSGTDTGVYTSAEGGNSDLLMVEVDPFTSYVSGYRNQIIIKTQIEVEKGLDTQYVEQTKTQINYGQYIEVKELVGAWDIQESTLVDLYDTPQQVITNLTHSTATVAGSAIGTARVRSIEYVSGTKGTADARYYLYLYEIAMVAGKTFSQVRAIYDSATPKRFADIVTTTAGAVLQETSFDSMIFPLPYDAVKTLRDTLQNVETSFRFKKKFTVSFTSGVATIATDTVTETFVGTDTLNSTQKNDFYMVVVNNGGANVETSALTGTVTVGASSTAVTGSGTLFTSQYNVGDLIKIGSTTTHRIASIASATALTLATAHGAGATGVAHTKIIPTGTVLSLSDNGGKGSTRTVNVTSPGTASIDVQENATFTADVIVSMDRANAREKIKTLNFQTQANINPNTHISGLSGPFGLGVGDIYQLHAVYQSSSFDTAATTGNTNVISSFTLDNGQRDYAYEHGSIRPVTGFVPSGRLLAVFDNFTHDTSQGVGYASVDSYPINDEVSSNTTIATSRIPIFTSPTTKKIFKLRDSVDFRPIKTANTALNPIDVGTYQVPTFGLRIPQSNSDFDADLIYYKGRISKVYINNAGVFGINDGVPAQAGNQRAESPPTKPDTLEIAELIIPAYPSLPIDVQIKLLKNKRLTMREVARMNERLERLEYFTALSFLEKQATDTTELDNDGLDRFKNGILVDPFTGWAVASTSNDAKDCAIDKKNNFVTAKQDNSNTVGLRYSTTGTTTSTTSLQVGNKIMLPYTEVEAPGLKQQYASRQLRLAEELNFIWTGDLSVMPFADTFFDTVNDPTKAQVYNDDQGADNWKALIDAWNTEVAPLNQHWLGGTQQTVDTAQQTTQQGNQNVTTALRTVTQEAFNKIATGQRPLASKQEVSFDRVVSVEVALWMRQREFVIYAKGLKNNARVYAFFDGVNVTANCYQIQLLGTSTLQTLNKFNNAGVLEDENVTWKAIADGANTAQPLIVKNNEIYLLFEVPSKKFYTGQREFKITDSPTNSEGTTLTSARNIITSQGVIQKTASFSINSRPFTSISFDTQRSIGRRTVSSQRVETGRVTIPPPQNWDPLSQSFFVDPNTFERGMYLTSIDLFFRTKSQSENAYVTVEIRELENGFPSPELISDGDNAVVKNTDINVSENASVATKCTFKNPIYLSPGVDYCFTVKPSNNDPDFALWVAELGAVDITEPNKQTRIESAYNSGVLFSSSNDKTWAVKQNTDMKFTMRVAQFDTTTSKVAFWNNIPLTTAFTYDALTPSIADVVLAGTNIKYEIKTSDSNLAVDEDFTTIKKYERLVLRSRKQISTSASETAANFKSLLVKATLSTTNKYISPYIDNEKLLFHFDKNIINNLDETAVSGTVTYASGNNVVIGTGTTFTTQVFPGEYAYFGDEYRRVSSISSNTVLTVSNNFTTSNAVSQAMTVRNEENPTGAYSSQSRYITKVVTLNDGFEASDLVTYLKINRPPGTSIKVYCKLLNENDTDAFDDKFYTPMELVGTETFTLNQNEYKEEKYVVPSTVKTGGSEFLAGTVAISNVSTTVIGTSTRFIEDLKIGDTIAVGTARTERVVATIANNTALTVESAFSTVASGQDIFRVLNNTVAYTTPDGRTFQGYKNFAIKITFLSSNPSYAPKVKDLRGIALA